MVWTGTSVEPAVQRGDHEARPVPGPGGEHGGHLQQPTGPPVEAAGPAAALAVSRLLSVSVRVGSQDMEETMLVEVDEDVGGWCWWCC